MSHTPTDTDTLVAHIAVIKRATEAGRESCEGDWHGKDFTHEQSAYDPSEVDHAIAAILNAVADGSLVRADRIEALEAEVAHLRGLEENTYAASKSLHDDLQTQLTEARAGEDELREALAQYANPDLYRSHPHGLAFDSRDKSYIAFAALASHDKRKEKR